MLTHHSMEHYNTIHSGPSSKRNWKANHETTIRTAKLRHSKFVKILQGARGQGTFEGNDTVTKRRYTPCEYGTQSHNALGSKDDTGCNVTICIFCGGKSDNNLMAPVENNFSLYLQLLKICLMLCISLSNHVIPIRHNCWLSYCKENR